jgi:hypothetical protein
MHDGSKRKKAPVRKQQLSAWVGKSGSIGSALGEEKYSQPRFQAYSFALAFSSEMSGFCDISLEKLEMEAQMGIACTRGNLRDRLRLQRCAVREAKDQQAHENQELFRLMQKREVLEALGIGNRGEQFQKRTTRHSVGDWLVKHPNSHESGCANG